MDTPIILAPEVIVAPLVFSKTMEELLFDEVGVPQLGGEGDSGS